MVKTGECALCKNEAELKLSHIIPKFVFRNLKKDSFTGILRTTSEPNKALQDGKKEYLLCQECEGRFSYNETQFSNKVLIPFKKEGFNSALHYESDWLNRFITSVSWRILYLDLEKFEKEQNPEKKLTEDMFKTLRNAEEIMRLYLLNKRLNLNGIENHIFFFDEVESKSGFDNPHTLMHGSVFGSTVIRVHDAKNVIYVASNLLGILIVTIIQKHPKEKWRNTFVKNESGKIKIPQILDSPIAWEILQAQKLQKQYKQELSPNQKEKIIEKIKNDPEGFMESGTYKRIMLDQNLK
ncbi:hypothetical protein [Bacillus thuringiensis]|uniref:hypothetical protein n=1 Tax=Bacillus thuringiensis TaxID=1428 RepID=UPI00077E2183|nr:hypothetical protein [Bacillus thuringiensis]AMR06364.1 hypothetical protein AXW78_29125 [Bacillus thuringiensis]